MQAPELPAATGQSLFIKRNTGRRCHWSNRSRALQSTSPDENCARRGGTTARRDPAGRCAAPDRAWRAAGLPPRAGPEPGDNQRPQVAWARGYGECGGEQRRPVTPATRFQAASISKPVAAAAALRLVAEGRLALDADVNEYLASWKLPANGAWQPRVTLRQLLSHSAGLTVHGFPGYERGEALRTLREVLDGQAPAKHLLRLA